MKPIPSTAIRENRDGRAWDGRTIEEPPALNRATWIARVLIVALVIVLAVATCRSL
ncbi:hypothetical protein [uncultured Bradyrhizobium sp.]|uniref:hypothetical protein n=1 Tax=uncultured Bradyrhizobium sp. TaxID=199684 RepID=UPI002616501E|nr:hypothetical protein [uncultured Bradyrhizobium sp.]